MAEIPPLFSWLAEMIALKVNYLSCIEEKGGLMDICCITQNAALFDKKKDIKFSCLIIFALTHLQHCIFKRTKTCIHITKHKKSSFSCKAGCKVISDLKQTAYNAMQKLKFCTRILLLFYLFFRYPFRMERERVTKQITLMYKSYAFSFHPEICIF